MVRFRYGVPPPKNHPLVSSAEGLLDVPAYQIDAQDIVVAVNEAWRASAHAHGRLDLAPYRVLGQSFWQCIRTTCWRWRATSRSPHWAGGVLALFFLTCWGAWVLLIGFQPCALSYLLWR